jgi:uncharacterized protein (DUF58 family)
MTPLGERAREAVLAMRPAMPARDEAVLGRRQLYMLPTRHGLLFSLVLFVMLLAGINYENGLVYGLTFLLAGIAVISMLYTHRNLLGLHIRSGGCVPVFAGQPAEFPVCLVNAGATARVEISVEYAKTTIAHVDIEPHGQRCVAFQVATHQRGWLPMPEVGVSTQFPLGLLYSWSRRVRIDQRCLVYPRPAPPQAAPRRAGSEPWRESARDREGDDFVGVRDYQHGDSPRHINWKAVARGLPWQIKRFGGEQRQSVWLDWDQLDGLDTESRLSLLCRWIIDAEDEGLVYGMRIPGHTITPGQGADHRHDCLETLALFEDNA